MAAVVQRCWGDGGSFGALPSAESLPVPRCFRAGCGTVFLRKPRPLRERAAGCPHAQNRVSRAGLSPAPSLCSWLGHVRLREQLGELGLLWGTGRSGRRDARPQGTLAAGLSRPATLEAGTFAPSGRCRLVLKDASLQHHPSASPFSECRA